MGGQLVGVKAASRFTKAVAERTNTPGWHQCIPTPSCHWVRDAVGSAKHLTT